jgi:hypothetical protein
MHCENNRDCSQYACPICQYCAVHCLGHYQLLSGLMPLLRPIHTRTKIPMTAVANARFVAVRDLQKKAA